MKHAPVDTLMPSTPRFRRRSVGPAALAIIGSCALVLGACGGGDDDASDDSTATTTQASTTQPQNTSAATTTAAPTTTTTLPPLDLVTEGAVVVVANASGIDGAAGRMTDALIEVGFTTGTPTNSSEGPMEISKIYYDPANELAKPVADSVREALGGGDIEVLELVVPAPTDTGEIGDATVLVAMGNDTADKPLDELQGRVAAAPEESTADETTADETTTDETSGESSGEATTEDTSGG